MLDLYAGLPPIPEKKHIPNMCPGMVFLEGLDLPELGVWELRPHVAADVGHFVDTDIHWSVGLRTWVVLARRLKFHPGGGKCAPPSSPRTGLYDRTSSVSRLTNLGDLPTRWLLLAATLRSRSVAEGEPLLPLHC